MEAVLCDELLYEIFLRLTPPSSAASGVPLVSKRWLRLYRTSRTTLTLRFDPQDASFTPYLPTLLSHYPILSSLSVVSVSTATAAAADRILLAVSSSTPNLRQLRLFGPPVSVFSLISLSTSCTHLASLAITLSRPLYVRWLASFPFLKELSLVICSGRNLDGDLNSGDDCIDWLFGNLDAELPLESLSLSGIQFDDQSLGWLWKSCKKLRRLQLQRCDCVDEGGSFSSFVKCLEGLQEVELRTCRSIANGVLVKLAENCLSLKSLLIYDGGSKDGLLQFINHCKCNLRRLDLRLPLDFDNRHLSALAQNFRSLSCLRLQSCCLVTGEGLKTLGLAMSSRLEELALINCDVVENEPGLLTSLGQSLKQLRKLDLSHNEMLLDKEFISMLVSCNHLIDLKLRGCKRLTNVVMVSMLRSCKHLESIDIMHCSGIGSWAIELFVLNSPQLRQVQVENSKVSDAARARASHKFVEVAV